MEGFLQGFEYEIERKEGKSCSYCGRSGALLSRKGGSSDLLLCEACTLMASLAWRQVAGEVPPGFPEEEASRPASVAVLIVRRREVSDPDAPKELPAQMVREPAEMPSSYEFLLAEQSDGSALPPMAVVTRGRSVTETAMDALASVDMTSWPALLEQLYVGYTPRGRLSAVVLARGWVVSAGSSCVWKPWPLWKHVGLMAGFYQAVESVWPLRVYKHVNPGDGTEISVRVREAARLYVELQVAQRSGADVDTLMSSVYRAAMTDEEVAVASVVLKADERAREEKRLLSAVPEEESSDDEEDDGESDEYVEEETGEAPPDGFARNVRKKES